jgi:hypothetical protein
MYQKMALVCFALMFLGCKTPISPEQCVAMVAALHELEMTAVALAEDSEEKRAKIQEKADLIASGLAVGCSLTPLLQKGDTATYIPYVDVLALRR